MAQVIKKHRYLAIITLVVTLLGLVAAPVFVVLHSPQQAQAAIPDGHPQFGNTQLVLTAGTASGYTADLSNVGTGGTFGIVSGGTGSATYTGGTGSIACYNMQLSLNTTGSAVTAFVGSSSATCTYPVYPTPTNGTAGVQAFQIPQALNVSQLWIALVNTSSTNVSSGTVNAMYTR